MWNLKQFKDIYSRYQSSGLRIEEFCRNECIVRSKFYYWQRKLCKSSTDSGQRPGFVPVVFSGAGLQYQPSDMISRQPDPGQHPPCNEFYEIVYPGGVALRVPRGTDLAQLRSLILLMHPSHV